jgi:signal transduction histidine kinase
MEKNLLLEEANNKLLESEKHLKDLNATKDRFFTLIAHDLKNPFTALMGFSEILKKNFDSFEKEEIKDLINIIFESSQNLYKLLDNLLQWSRSQTGGIMYRPENFPLLPLIKQEIEVLEPLADKKSIKFITRVEDHLMVFADKNLVSVIIRNLLNNAIKFSNQEGKITITSKENEKMVNIAIIDTGIGMEKDELDKLFRLDTSFSSRGTADEEGTGLGLLVCKEFIEKNGGEILVTSEKSKGSKFQISLPLLRLT